MSGWGSAGPRRYRLRRAGLARLVKRADLRAALPIYLRNRPDVPVDETSVTVGLQWAMKKVNETVSLLMPNYRAGVAAELDRAGARLGRVPHQHPADTEVAAAGDHPPVRQHRHRLYRGLVAAKTAELK